MYTTDEAVTRTEQRWIAVAEREEPMPYILCKDIRDELVWVPRTMAREDEMYTVNQYGANSEGSARMNRDLGTLVSQWGPETLGGFRTQVIEVQVTEASTTYIGWVEED